MNKKRTNLVVTILNVIKVVSMYILFFSTDYLLTGIMSGENGGSSIFDSFIVETLLKNIQLINSLVYGGIGILNIVCSIQNKENKKLFFWQLIFGIYNIWSAIALGIFADNKEIIKLGSIIISTFAIIMAIINFIKIRKNKPKVIQVVSYVAVVIISILDILGILGAQWELIAVIMQLIYIHYQEKNIEENNSREIINIVLYYVLQLIIVASFCIMIVSSLLITVANRIILNSELDKMYSEITTMQDAMNEEICVPVEKNYKYGFINERGQEKIPCEYDRVSFFNKIEINNNTYYISIAQKEENVYIISKSNDAIPVGSTFTKCMKKMYSIFDKSMKESYDENYILGLGYVMSFEFCFKGLYQYNNEKVIDEQTLQTSSKTNEISLSKNNSQYTYKNNNFSMLIEPIYEENEFYNYEEDDKTKYRVTITKRNGETESNIVYLPELYEYRSVLKTYTNGYIAFKTDKENGWYDTNGNLTTISNNYEIKDIKADKIIIMEITEDNYNETNFFILDITGKKLLETTALNEYDNTYLIKNSSNKMVLLDKNLKVISNEYDRIISDNSIDTSSIYCSYYQKK